MNLWLPLIRHINEMRFVVATRTIFTKQRANKHTRMIYTQTHSYLHRDDDDVIALSHTHVQSYLRGCAEYFLPNMVISFVVVLCNPDATSGTDQIDPRQSHLPQIHIVLGVVQPEAHLNSVAFAAPVKYVFHDPWARLMCCGCAWAGGVIKKLQSRLLDTRFVGSFYRRTVDHFTAGTITILVRFCHTI